MRTTHLLDLITWKGCEKARNVWHTYDNSWCPVAVSAPWTEARFTRCLSTRDERYRYGVYTLRAYYAICLWRKTFETLMSGDARRYDVEWVDVADGFRSVRYLHKPVSELIAEFRSELKRNADAGTVSVRLGRYDYPSPAGNPKLIVNDYVLEPEMFMEDRGFHRPEKWSAVAPGEPKTFGWEEVKDYFVDLNEIEVAFLEGAKMRRCTELDGRFLKACEECDLVEMKRLLDAGANMYATDEWGDCAGGKLVESCWDEPAEGKKKAQEALELLLDRGYDLDFCGYDSTTPLYEATYSNDADMLEFLLAKGANPNVPSWISVDEELRIPYERLDEEKFIEGEYDDDGMLERMQYSLLRHGSLPCYDGDCGALGDLERVTKYDDPEVMKRHPALISDETTPDNSLIISAQHLCSWGLQLARKHGGDLAVRDVRGRSLLQIALEDAKDILTSRKERAWTPGEFDYAEFVLVLFKSLDAPYADADKAMLEEFCAAHGYERMRNEIRKALS